MSKTTNNKNKLGRKPFYVFIPTVALILTLANQIIFFILNYIQINKITNSGQEIAELIELVQKYIDYNEHNAIATIIGLFATVVSVWVSLSIYNIVEKKDVEKTKEELIVLTHQMESLKDNYSTFNIGSLKYIEVWEDRVNGYYTDKIWGILKANNYPAYEIATAMVRIENLLNCIAERYNNNSFYQMKDFLKRYKEEIESLEIQVKKLCRNYPQTQDDTNILNSYIACRNAEYYYYLYFRDKYYGKNTACSCLDNACESYEKALFLCPDANVVSKGYIDNVLAFIYFEKYRNNSTKSKIATEYINKALEYSTNAVKYDSHYARNYRNHGVNIECHAKATGTDYVNALREAKEQYSKALECDGKDYKNFIAYVSCVLKGFDLEFQISERIKPIKSEISQISDNMREDIMDEINTCYNYLTLAILNNPNDSQAHYHMIHVLMYMYLCKKNTTLHCPISINEIIFKAKTEIGNCEAIYVMNPKQVGMKAYLFKARNFYESIEDIKNASQYNDKILNLYPNSQDAKNLKNFYELKQSLHSSTEENKKRRAVSKPKKY